MKSILSYITPALLLCSFAVNAQQFSPTTGVPCQPCLPANYESTLRGNGGPLISDIAHPAGKQSLVWNIAGSQLPVPPSLYSQGLPAGAGKNSFLTLRAAKGASNDDAYLIVSGFDTNKEYKMKYHVLSGSVVYTYIPDVSPFGESAKVTITTTGQTPALVVEQTTTFTSANQNQWISKELTFKPLSSTLKFKFSGNQSTNVNGFVNFDIDKYPFECQLPNNQVQLGNPIINTVFKGDNLDLSKVRVDSETPAGAEIVWKTNPNSTYGSLTAQQASSVSISNLDPANLKIYYAFYYAKDFNCYSVPVSQAGQQFNYMPTQVALKQTNVGVSCAEPTANLTALLDDPKGAVLWFKNNNHQGTAEQNPQAAGPGDYYAFYYDAGKGGYSLPANQVSNAHVKVENAMMAGIPNLGPTMSINSLVFPPNASKDFVVRIHNLKAENSNCMVYFMVSKMPGFTISYNTQAGQSNVDGGIFNNNDFWTFTENSDFIKVTSKNGIPANGYSDIGFKVTRNSGTPASTTQNLSVFIPAAGGGGEQITTNNTVINAFSTGIN